MIKMKHYIHGVNSIIIIDGLGSASDDDIS